MIALLWNGPWDGRCVAVPDGTLHIPLFRTDDRILMTHQGSKLLGHYKKTNKMDVTGKIHFVWTEDKEPKER